MMFIDRRPDAVISR